MGKAIYDSVAMSVRYPCVFSFVREIPMAPSSFEENSSERDLLSIFISI